MKCQWPRCRAESGLRYLGRELCWGHLAEVNRLWDKGKADEIERNLHLRRGTLSQRLIAPATNAADPTLAESPAPASGQDEEPSLSIQESSPTGLSSTSRDTGGESPRTPVGR